MRILFGPDPPGVNIFSAVMKFIAFGAIIGAGARVSEVSLIIHVYIYLSIYIYIYIYIYIFVSFSLALA